MTEDEVLAIMREYYSGLFPKVCPNCQRRFATLREYVVATKPVGRYMSYDVESGSWTPEMGTLALANCPCGNTMGMSTEALAPATRAVLLGWVKSEAERRSMNPTDLLAYLRVELRRQIMAEPG